MAEAISVNTASSPPPLLFPFELLLLEVFAVLAALPLASFAVLGFDAVPVSGVVVLGSAVPFGFAEVPVELPTWPGCVDWLGVPGWAWVWSGVVCDCGAGCVEGCWLGVVLPGVCANATAALRRNANSVSLIRCAPVQDLAPIFRALAVVRWACAFCCCARCLRRDTPVAAKPLRCP
jgi:hypothetical protein